MTLYILVFGGFKYGNYLPITKEKERFGKYGKF